MKNEYKAYLERMNRFNEWEQQRNLEHTKDTATSVKEHLAFMELDHQLIPEDKKEQLRKEKLKCGKIPFEDILALWQLPMVKKK